MKRAVLYMRVSTLDQHPETQLQDLRQMVLNAAMRWDCEYPPPVPRLVRGGGRVGLSLPGNPADLDNRGQLHLAELEGGGHQA